MKFDLQQWSQFGLAFAVGVSLSAVYVAVGAVGHRDPQVIVVEERCPALPDDAAPTPPPMPPMSEPAPVDDPLGLRHEPAYYGIAQTELEAMVETCELRDDRPGEMTDEIAAALGLSEAERTAWSHAEARLFGREVAMRFAFLHDLAPDQDFSELDLDAQDREIETRAAATKDSSDATLLRRIAEERAGLRKPQRPEWIARESLWAQWQRYQFSHGDRFAESLAIDLGEQRVDELRRRFAGWPGQGLRHTGCEAQPKVEAEQDMLTVSDGLALDIVRRIVRAHLPELQDCYSAALAKDAELGATVVLTFTIDAEGNIAEVGVEETAADGERELAACIVGAARRWRFPKPADGARVNVRYPLHFSID